MMRASPDSQTSRPSSVGRTRHGERSRDRCTVGKDLGAYRIVTRKLRAGMGVVFGGNASANRSARRDQLLHNHIARRKDLSALSKMKPGDRRIKHPGLVNIHGCEDAPLMGRRTS